MDGHDARRALRGREPRRPLDRQPRRVRAHQLRRHQRHVRRRPPARRRAVPAHLHRRGLRLDRGGLVHARPTRSVPARRTRRRRPAPTSSRCRTTTTYGLPVVVTRSSNNFGPYQFPEKVIPLFVTNLLDGQQGAALRRRPQRARLVLRRGQLRRRRPRAAQGRRRRDLQHRRRQRGHQPRAHRPASSTLLRRATSRRSSTSRTASATTAATRSTARRCGRSGWAPDRELRRGARGHGRVVPRQPLVVGAAQGPRR